jgi:hypothetical protein
MNGHQSIHWALWWFINSNSTIFCFWSYQASCKLTTKKTTVAKYTAENTLFYLLCNKKQLLTLCNDQHDTCRKIHDKRSRSFENICNKFSQTNTTQTKTTEQDDKSATAAPTILNVNALSTGFQILLWSIHFYSSTTARLQYSRTQHFVRYNDSKYDWQRESEPWPNQQTWPWIQSYDH